MSKKRNLLAFKKKVLFDEETGLIRPGITNMSDYAEIFYATSEEEVEEAIQRIMDRSENDDLFEDIEEENDQEEI
ncbi:MAG: hypothetical protein J5I47_07730 [Vicingus serpentipes]|nr:hypothetical protein [Vicingus serpentipes]